MANGPVGDPKDAQAGARFAELKAAYQRSGARGYWQVLLDQAKEPAKKEYVIPSDIAVLAARVEDKNQAFEWIQKSMEARDDWLTVGRFDPAFDSLRSDPRYADALRKMGLPQ